MRLYSFDVDGTLEVGVPPGPVRLLDLAKLAAGGDVVGLTGHHERVSAGFPVAWRRGSATFATHGGRAGVVNAKTYALADAAGEHPGAPVKVHVGDDEIDRVAATLAGWRYMTPEEFAAWI